MLFRHKPTYLALALLSAAKAPAQQPAPAFDPKAAVTEALHRLDAADTDARRYTYVEKITMATVARTGRLVDGNTRKYEALYINDHQYLKLLEVDDQPLTGSALKDEQKRYDKAISKKHELDTKKRADSDGFTFVKPDFDLASVLTPAYSLKELNPQMTRDGDTLHVIDASLVPGTKIKSTCRWHLRLWISSRDGILTAYATDTAGDKSPSCIDASEEKRYILVDGLPKLSAEARRLNIQEGGFDLVPHEFLIAYTDYRRFHATVTLGAATEVPDENSPALPPETPPVK